MEDRTHGRELLQKILFAVVLTMLAIVVVSLLFKGSAPGLVRLLKIYAGFGAILGHNYPFYLSFKGGKGIACTAGTIGTLEWQLVLICLASFFVPVLITRYVSLGSLILNLTFLIASVVMGQKGMLGMTGPQLTEMYVILGMIVLMAFWRHRENIGNLLRGTERKIYLKKRS